MAVIINRGQRTYKLADGPNGQIRELGPGASLEVTDREAKQMTGYKDIVDALKAVPQNAAEIERLKAENARLKEEQHSLRESAPVPEPEPEPKHEHHKANKAGHKKRGR